MHIIDNIKLSLSAVPKIIKKNIKYKLFIIFVLVISIPVIVFGFISGRMISSALEKDYVNGKQQLNKQIAKNVNENIKNLAQQSIAVYTNLGDIIGVLTNFSKLDTDYLDNYKRVSNYLQSVLQSNEKIYGITLISLDGDIIYYCSRQGRSINLYNVKNESWFQETLNLKGFPLVLEPHENKYVDANIKNKKSVISISRAIVSLETNQPYGIILFDQEISQFIDILKDVEVEEEETIIVYGNTGNVIYANNTLNDATYQKLMTNVFYRTSDSFRLEEKTDTLLINSSEAEDFGWKVVSILPLSVLQRKNLFLRNINASLLSILIIFSFILSMFFSYLINLPLKKLMKSFIKLKEGDFSTRVTITGEDELSQIGYTFNIMVESIRNLIQQKYEIGLLRKQAELESLQSQINPHFFFNTLTSLKAVIDKMDFVTSSTMVENLSDIFRYSLNRGKFVVKFSDELEHVKKYLFIQECRFSGKYNVLYDIDDEVLNCNIVRLTLQPIVENALYHGLEPKTGRGELKIIAKAFSGNLYIYITDNGVGISEENLSNINNLLAASSENQQNMNPEKMGIYNVNARIKFHFGDNYGLKMFRNNGLSTTVKITLPYQKAKGVNLNENFSS